MTVGSLFSGIGGIDLGLERAGFTVRWFCESDPYATSLIRRHWPGLPIVPDVRDVRAGTLETVDLICGGFPCQPVSLAGKRKAQGDSRWLWPEVARVLDEIRPSVVLLENVPGLLSAGGSEVVSDITSLGYDAEWHCFPASAVGAWHKRDRWWCVAADASGERCDSRTGLCSSNETKGRWRHISDTRCGDNASDTDSKRQPWWEKCNCQPNAGRKEAQYRLDVERRDICHTQRPRLEIGKVFGGDFQQELTAAFRANREDAFSWETIAGVRWTAHGVPKRVDKLRCFGNAVVPQVAEVIGRRILKAIGD